MSIVEAMNSTPVTCPSGTSAERVARLMSERAVGSVVVVDAEHKAIGIVTDRDLALRLVGTGRSTDTPVEDVMTAEPVTISASATPLDAAKHMAARGCRRLPVIDAETRRVIGVVTFDDLLLGAVETVQQISHVLADERHRD